MWITVLIIRINDDIYLDYYWNIAAAPTMMITFIIITIIFISYVIISSSICGINTVVCIEI